MFENLEHLKFGKSNRKLSCINKNSSAEKIAQFTDVCKSVNTLIQKTNVVNETGKS